MTPLRWRIGGIVAALLILVAGWFVLVSPTLARATALDTETAAQQSANQQLRSRISLLKKQSEELPTQEARLASIQQRMPATPALPTLIRNLTNVAEDANVTVSQVSPGRPAAIEAPKKRPAGAATAAPTGGTGSDAASSGAASSGAAKATTSTAAPEPDVQTMALDITVCGTFAQLRNYLRGLEGMRRVAMVSGLSISRGSCAEGSPDTDLTATITAHVFTLPTVTALGATSASGGPRVSDKEGSGDE